MSFKSLSVRKIKYFCDFSLTKETVMKEMDKIRKKSLRIQSFVLKEAKDI